MWDTDGPYRECRDCGTPASARRIAGHVTARTLSIAIAVLAVGAAALVLAIAVAWLARQMNVHIRQFAKFLRDEAPVGFYCECGCMEIVLLTYRRVQRGRRRVAGRP